MLSISKRQVMKQFPLIGETISHMYVTDFERPFRPLAPTPASGSTAPLSASRISHLPPVGQTDRSRGSLTVFTDAVETQTKSGKAQARNQALEMSFGTPDTQAGQENGAYDTSTGHYSSHWQAQGSDSVGHR